MDGDSVPCAGSRPVHHEADLEFGVLFEEKKDQAPTARAASVDGDGAAPGQGGPERLEAALVFVVQEMRQRLIAPRRMPFVFAVGFPEGMDG